jgi:hypothetical protein
MEETMKAQVGQIVRVVLPYSEVCCYLGVAGQEREVEVLPFGAQIRDGEGRNVSFPVTHGEAGIRLFG